MIVLRNLQKNMNKIVDKLDDVKDISFATVKAPTNAVKNNVEIFYNGWKRFVFKDSILNIAVMIIAKSFKNTVNSVVVDIIMPLIIGFGVGANVHDLFLVLVDGKRK